MLARQSARQTEQAIGRLEVFIPVVPALMSLLCRIASTAVIFIARLDGIQAEIKTVISAVTAAAITDSGDTQIRIGMTRLEPIDMKRSPISKSVPYAGNAN